MPSRFDYIKYDDHSVNDQNKAKEMCQNLEALIESFGSSLAERAKGEALKALEVTYMWVGKMIRDSQIVRTGRTELQEERKDG